MAQPSGKELAGWMTAGLLVLAGAVAIVIGASTPASFGWFAYQPLADVAFTPGGDFVFVSRVTIFGFVALSLGLITLAFVGGWRLARRSAA
jgi:heme/copper-type cytochrome/quinol oxidase subunit 1